MSSKNNTESDDNPQHVPNENGDNQDDVLEEGYDNYIYRDFAHVTCSDPRSSKNHPAPHKLPAKLGAILTDPAMTNVAAWLPHGRSWRILDRHRFMNEVLPQYFEHSNFNSFVRLVNAWGFRRVTSGVDSDSYYHELFLRGMPHLHTRMKRLLLNEKKAPVGSNDRCPNFHQIPLPNNPVANAPSIAANPHNVASSMVNVADVTALIPTSGSNQQMIPSLPTLNPNTQCPQSNPYIANLNLAYQQIANNAQSSQQLQQQQQQSQQVIIAAQMSSLANTIAQQYQYILYQQNLLAQQALLAASLLQQNHTASFPAVSSYPQVPGTVGQQPHISNPSSVPSNPSSLSPMNPVIANLINLLCNPVQSLAPEEINTQYTGNFSNQFFSPVQVNSPTQAIEQRQNQCSDDVRPLNASSEQQVTESSTDLNTNGDENNDSKKDPLA